jgi:hypothetical protein
MAVITKNDISEINNDLSNIKSELSEKLFLHEKEQDEKIEQLVYKLQILSESFDYELEAVSERLNCHSDINESNASILNDHILKIRHQSDCVEQLIKEIKFIKYVTAFLAIVSVIALLK